MGYFTTFLLATAVVTLINSVSAQSRGNFARDDDDDASPHFVRADHRRHGRNDLRNDFWRSRRDDDDDGESGGDDYAPSEAGFHRDDYARHQEDDDSMKSALQAVHRILGVLSKKKEFARRGSRRRNLVRSIAIASAIKNAVKTAATAAAKPATTLAAKQPPVVVKPQKRDSIGAPPPTPAVVVKPQKRDSIGGPPPTTAVPKPQKRGSDISGRRNKPSYSSGLFQGLFNLVKQLDKSIQKALLPTPAGTKKPPHHKPADSQNNLRWWRKTRGPRRPVTPQSLRKYVSGRIERIKHSLEDIQRVNEAYHFQINGHNDARSDDGKAVAAKIVAAKKGDGKKVVAKKNTGGVAKKNGAAGPIKIKKRHGDFGFYFY